MVDRTEKYKGLVQKYKKRSERWERLVAWLMWLALAAFHVGYMLGSQR